MGGAQGSDQEAILLQGRVNEQDAAPSGSQRVERAVVAALTIIYLLCASGFALVTPYPEAPDELSHLRYSEFMVIYQKLPRMHQYPYTAEASQPPLYYALGAAGVLAFRAIRMDSELRRPLTPEDRPSPEPERGRIVQFLHPPEIRWLMWPMAFRALSILMGLGVVLLTYATARALVPPPLPAIVPIIAVGFAALNPQANFIRASVSNENLADLIGAWIIWLLALHLTKPYSSRRVHWLGVAYGLGLLTKLTIAPFLLPIALVLWVRRRGHGRSVLRDAAVAALFAFALAGWFYIFRWWFYGDPLATRSWAEMLPPNSPWSLADFFWFQEPFRMMLWTSFWGVFGWQVIFMPDWIYDVLTAVTLLAAVGGAYLVIRRALTRAQEVACIAMLGALLLLYASVIQISLQQISWQGRELYPALSSVCVLFGFGLGGLLLGRGAVRQQGALSAWRRRLGAGGLTAVLLGLTALNAYAIGWLVYPTFR